MTLVWDEGAWDDYVWRQAQDRKTLKRINALLADIARDGNEGIGKPERLKYMLGYRSRRITDEHRLVHMTADAGARGDDDARDGGGRCRRTGRRGACVPL